MNKALQNAEKKTSVDNALQRSKDQASTKSVTSTQQSTLTSEGATTGGTVTTTSTNANLRLFLTFSSSSYPLKDSWILDNGLDTHICNSSMQSWFIQTRLSEPHDNLMAGTQTISIESFGTVNITIQTPTGFQQMILLNVAYILDFMTNLVSENILCSKSLYFDNSRMHFHWDSQTVGYAEQFHGHYLLENNTQSTLQSSNPGAFSLLTKTSTMTEWHQILGHLFHNTVAHLESSAEGVKVLKAGNSQVPKTNKCQTCALSKSHRVISCSSDKFESSDKSFHRVTYNLMSLTTAMNKNQWVSHFSCIITGFNLVFTHLRKSDATEIIQKALNIIETRYNAKVIFFRSDREKALSVQFDNLISSKGITFESSAPDTPAQNGHSEQKGGILAIKARTMRIDAGLPTYLLKRLQEQHCRYTNKYSRRINSLTTRKCVLLNTT